MNGWIKLHRRILEWEWYDDINTKILFIHLLLTANHEDAKWHGIEIQRGEKLTSISKLAKETKLTVRQVRVAINHLKTTNEVTSKTTSQYTIIHLNNYDEYQTSDKQDDKRVTKERQTSDNKQEGEEGKKEKNINIPEKLIAIVDYWNSAKFQTKVKNQTVIPNKNVFPQCIKINNQIIEQFKKHKDYTLEEYKTAIRNYATEIANREGGNGYASHRFSFSKFITQKNGLEDFINYNYEQ